METTKNTLTSEDRAALSQLQQKASNLRQSASNHFLVALEGLMLAAIAWESIGKLDKPIINALSKVTTAIGLAVMGIFTYHAVNDRAKASKADQKLEKFGFDELTLPSEQVALAPAVNQPASTIQADGRQAEKLLPPAQQLAI